MAIGLAYSVDFEKSYSAYYFGLPAGDLKAKIFPGIFPTRVFSAAFFSPSAFLILYGVQLVGRLPAGDRRRRSDLRRHLSDVV